MTARLRVGVALGVGEIDLGDPREVRVLQAVAAFVFVAEVGESARPDVARRRRIRARPTPRCRGAAPRPARGRCASARSRRRRRGRSAPPRSPLRPPAPRRSPDAQAASWRAVGKPIERRIGQPEEPAEQPLSREQFGREIADMPGLDLFRRRAPPQSSPCRTVSANASAKSTPSRRACAQRWWTGLDSNQRTLARADLQSAAFNHSATCPQVLLASAKARAPNAEAAARCQRESAALARRDYRSDPPLRDARAAIACAPFVALPGEIHPCANRSSPPPRPPPSPFPPRRNRAIWR